MECKVFFRKKKAKPEAKTDVKPQEDKPTPKLEIKGTKPEPKKEPKKKEPKKEAPLATVLPFTAGPCCPKCLSVEHKVSKPKFCNGKRWVRQRCKHNLKTEHLVISCGCGFAWNQECATGIKVEQKPIEIPDPVYVIPRQPTAFERADEALRVFFEEELNMGAGFYAELKRLMVGSENLPAGMFASDVGIRGGNWYRQKPLNEGYYQTPPIEGKSEI